MPTLYVCSMYSVGYDRVDVERQNNKCSCCMHVPHTSARKMTKPCGAFRLQRLSPSNFSISQHNDALIDFMPFYKVNLENGNLKTTMAKALASWYRHELIYKASLTRLAFNLFRFWLPVVTPRIGVDL